MRAKNRGHGLGVPARSHRYAAEIRINGIKSAVELAGHHQGSLIPLDDLTHH